MEELQNKTEENTRKKGKHAKQKNDCKQKDKVNSVKKEENVKKEYKKSERILTIMVVVLALFTFILDIYYIYTKLTPKFKDVELEIGYEKEISIKNFIIKEKYLEDSKILTDLTKIDLSKVRRT